MKYKVVNLVNSNFFLKVTELERQETETEGEEIKFKVLGSYTNKCKRKDLQESFAEDQKKGIEHKVQIVSQEPQKFQLDTLYVRADKKFAWVYVVREN